ncbi:MAG: ribosome maturation factor RimP [Mycobacteriales bacterium]
MSASTTSRARLVQLLEPAVRESGSDLEDVSVSPAGKRRVVRVVVDRDGGITLDDVAAVSRAVSDVLDQAEEAEPDLLGGAYVLEVSSPGVDRPLTAARHWRRNVGRLVKATLADGELVTGRVTSADDAEVVLDVEGTPRTLLVAELVSGTVQLEFSRPGAPEDDLADETDDTEDETDELDETDEEAGA